ncbi:MAG: queuosine precursor transporter [Mycobacteriaceae bacterium]
MTLSKELPNTNAHPSYASLMRSYYPLVLTLFTAVVLISNITATKGVAFFADKEFSLGIFQILPINTDGAFFLFPLAYILGDVLSEVYGFKATRRAIYLGFGIALLASATFWFAINLPVMEGYSGQEAFRTVLGPVPRFLGAGLAAYLAGQFLNSYVLVKIKERTGERLLWVRLLGSTVVAEFVDTLIFCSIVATAIGITDWKGFVNYVIVGFLWKTLAEVLVLPFTYRVIAVIKKLEPSYQTA